MADIENEFNFSQNEPNEEFKLPQGYHDAISDEQDSLFAGLSSKPTVSKKHPASVEDPAFFNQIEPKTEQPVETEEKFHSVKGQDIFNDNQQLNQLGFSNPNYFNEASFSYPEDKKEEQQQPQPVPKEIPIQQNNDDWTNFLSTSTPSKSGIPVPLGVDPAKQFEVEERLANYEPKPDQDPYITRVEILRLSEIISVEEEAALYKLMLTKRDLVLKALDAQNKTGSTIILDELLGRKKNVILPDTIINIDDLGTETLTIKTLPSLSNRTYYPDMFMYDNCFCTIIQSRTSTRFSFNNKWEDIFLMIGHNEIRIFDSIQQAAAFEDPRTTILLSPYMNTDAIYDKKYTGIRIYILKVQENPEEIRHKKNLFVFDDEYETREILKIGSTSQQNVVIVKTQIQSLINKLKEESMKAAQTVQNHIESYHD